MYACEVPERGLFAWKDTLYAVGSLEKDEEGAIASVHVKPIAHYNREIGAWQHYPHGDFGRFNPYQQVLHFRTQILA